MERLCEYCKDSFAAKRIDMLYCSHSCRQMAYMLRKATPNSSLDSLKGLTYSAEVSTTMELENKKATGIEKLNEQITKLTDRNEKTSTLSKLGGQKESNTKNESYPFDISSNVSKDKPEISTTKTKFVETTVTKKDEEHFVDHGSPFIAELAELIEERDNLSKLSVLLYNNPETAAYWVSLRYKCLVECLLTFSEMREIELDDLKEVCNALTSIIQSKSFNYLPQRYPYTNDIIEVRETIKQFCLTANEQEIVKLEFKKTTKLKMLATRWELANYVTKENFNQLNFKE